MKANASSAPASVLRIDAPSGFANFEPYEQKKIRIK
jgi:hypothetical protein